MQIKPDASEEEGKQLVEQTVKIEIMRRRIEGYLFALTAPRRVQVKDILAKGGDPRNDGKIHSKSFIVYAQTLPGWFVRRILPTCMRACSLPCCTLLHAASAQILAPVPTVPCHMHAPCHAPVRSGRDGVDSRLGSSSSASRL